MGGIDLNMSMYHYKLLAFPFLFCMRGWVASILSNFLLLEFIYIYEALTW